MAIKRKSYCLPFNKEILDFSYGKDLMEDLGMKYRPDEFFYNWFMQKMHNWGTEGFLKNNFKIHGKENIKDGNYQIFLFNHELRYDPFMIEGAITLTSGIGTPIPAPAYKDYILNRCFSSILQKFYSYPIYSKKDGYIDGNKKISKKEKSLEYSEFCLFHYGRLLIFPTGELSCDGKQIKGVSEGKPVRGRLGSAEIIWRFYHHLHEKGFLEKGKKIQIIPGYVSYYPLDFIKKRKENSKVRIRFGNSLDVLFQKEIIDEFYSFKNRIKTFRNDGKKEELKIELQKKFMDNAMNEIGKLVTINMGHLGSRMIYDFAKKGMQFITKDFFMGKIKNLVEKIKDSKFYLSEHFDNEERMKKRYDFFLKECEEESFFINKGHSLELNLEKICFVPEDKKIRKENSVLYNFNKLEHLEKYKEIEKRVLEC